MVFTTIPKPANAQPRTPRADGSGMRAEQRTTLRETIARLVAEARAEGCRIAFAYLRISADDRLERKGVERQHEDAATVSEAQGCRLIHIFEDNDTTASKVRDDETEWAMFVECLIEFRPDLVIGFKGDRLGRRFGDIEILEDARRQWGVKLWTLAEGDYFANPAWPVLVAVSKMEVQNTSYRVRRAQRARVAEGKDTGGGARPYGYAPDRMTVIPSEARVIRFIARALLFKFSGVQIARHLNTRGVPTTISGKWATATVKSIAGAPTEDPIEREIATRVRAGENPKAVAKDLNEREIAPTRQPLWSSYMVRNIVSKPRVAGQRFDEDGTTVAAAWPAILDTQTYAAVVRRLDATSGADEGKKEAGRPVESLLGGIVRCGHCLSPLVAGQPGDGRHTYRCVGTVQDGRRIGGRHVQRNRAAIDKYVTDAMLSALDEGEVQSELSWIDQRIDEIETQITALELAIWEVGEQVKARKITPREWIAVREPWLVELREAEEERDRLYADERQVRELRSAAARWDEWSNAQRRAAIRARFDMIIVHPTSARGRAASVIRPGDVEMIAAKRAGS